MKNKSGAEMNDDNLQNIDNSKSKKNKELSLDERIYNALDKTEKILTKIASVNKFFRRSKKKKNKKLGKKKKVSGLLVLAPIKSQKKCKYSKRYKQKKKKK